MPAIDPGGQGRRSGGGPQADGAVRRRHRPSASGRPPARSTPRRRPGPQLAPAGHGVPATQAGRWAIEAVGLRKSFGTVVAVENLDLRVERGTVLALLGPNGAGKTTVVRMLATLCVPDAGTATVAGLDVLEDAPAVHSVIGLAGQSAAVDEHLTGRENLMLVGRLRHLSRRDAAARAAALLERFDLTGPADRRVDGWSGGMRRRLDLAASLVGRPKVLFLDEPTAGLDPRSRADLWEVIRGLVRRGTTVLLTTQYLEEADHLATRVAVLDAGRVVAEGTPAALKARVGGTLVEVALTVPARADAAASALGRVLGTAPQVDAVAGIVAVRLRPGREDLASIVRLLDAAGIGVADMTLRRPTLDDVFLTLTDRPDRR